MNCLDETDRLALAAGKLELDRAELDAHLAGCPRCRELVGALAPSSQAASPALARGLQPGRYTLLHQLGEGAMGSVYAAYDPELDRRVAVRILHAGNGDPAAMRTQLLREAQAMARLSHPNVIAVHDVGTVQDQVFIAMELVEGKTLSAWLRDEHSWREILRVFILAGRGLAAAHAAGVVHRDFTPDHVLVGKNGQVRVTDFGLAHALERRSQAGESLSRESEDVSLDQLSFATALYEALSQEPRSAGSDLREPLRENKHSQPRKEPEGARAPGWIWRVLSRGMAPLSPDRYPSVAALVDALEADPVMRWRRLGAALSAIALVAALAIFVYWQSRRAVQTCRGAEEKLHGVWDQPLRTKAKAAFSASKLSYAGKSWSLAEDALDRYANDWTRMRIDACEATAVRHVQPPDLLDLRMSCLDERLRSFGAASQLLSTADNEVVSRAIHVVGGLPALSGCADEHALRAPGAPTEAQRPAVDALRARLAQADVLGDAGKLPIELATEINDAAKKIGYGPLEAETLLMLGREQRVRGDAKAAQKTLADTTAAALSSKSDLVLADAWIALLDLDTDLSQLEAGEAVARQATAAVNRLGNPPSELGWLLLNLGVLARQENRIEEALHDTQQAVDLLEKTPAGPMLTIRALDEHADNLAIHAQWNEAIAMQLRAYNLSVTTFGPEHWISGETENVLGGMLDQRERTREARLHLEHALVVEENALGLEHPWIEVVLDFLGNNSTARNPTRAIAYLQRGLRVGGEGKGEENLSIAHTRFLLSLAFEANGQLEQARKEVEQAIAMEFRITPDPNDMDAAMMSTALGHMLIVLGDLKRARPMLETALAAEMKTYGPEHPAVGSTLAWLGQLALLENRLETARHLLEQSLALALRDMPGGSVDSVTRELLLAEVMLAQGQYTQALPALERIAAIPDSGPDTPLLNLAQAHALLARALWPDKKERPRAVHLAELAGAEYATRTTRDTRERAALQRWVKTHHL